MDDAEFRDLIVTHMVLVTLAGKAAERRARIGSEASWHRHLTVDEGTSYHESGHAVIALASGFDVYEASIIHGDVADPGETQRTNGRVWIGLGPDPRSSPGYERSDKAGSDTRKAIRSCSELIGTRRWQAVLNLVRVLRARSAELVETHWLDICSVAQQLLEQKELNHDELAALGKKFSRRREIEAAEIERARRWRAAQ